MTRAQELYRIIDINRTAINLLRKDLEKIQNRLDERWNEIEKAFKELDELCRI